MLPLSPNHRCRQHSSALLSKTSYIATPIATKPSKHLSQSLFTRPAVQVAPEFIGCRHKELMASVMAIESEVFGRCVEEIKVSVEVEYDGRWLCCGWKYLRFILAGKAAQDWCRRVVMVPGIGGCFGRFGCD